MHLHLLAAGLVTALPLTAEIPTAAAADLFDPYGSGYSASPYDDPRYADIYRHPKPPPRHHYGKPLFEEPDENLYDADPEAPDVGPRRYVKPYDNPYGWSDRRPWRGEYLDPLLRAPDFGDYHPRAADLPPGTGCLPGHQVRRELIRDGWSDFHDFSAGGRFAFVTARRPNGVPYRLKLDRCAGEIVRADRIDAPSDSYAWRRREAYPAY